MTIEKVLGCSADELEKMTDTELDAHFKPMYTITRPEMAPKPEKSFNRRSIGNKDINKMLGAQMLKGFGIDLDDL